MLKSDAIELKGETAAFISAVPRELLRSWSTENSIEHPGNAHSGTTEYAWRASRTAAKMANIPDKWHGGN